jgi:toxin HigB-1
MIRTFRSKALAELWNTGVSAKIDPRMQKRILRRLDRLNVSKASWEMDLPGFNFHTLKGHVPTLYTVHVNGPWCITFEFAGEDAVNVDFQQYH